MLSCTKPHSHPFLHLLISLAPNCGQFVPHIFINDFSQQNMRKLLPSMPSVVPLSPYRVSCCLKCISYQEEPDPILTLCKHKLNNIIPSLGISRTKQTPHERSPYLARVSTRKEQMISCLHFLFTQYTSWIYSRIPSQHPVTCRQSVQRRNPHMKRIFRRGMFEPYIFTPSLQNVFFADQQPSIFGGEHSFINLCFVSPNCKSYAPLFADFIFSISSSTLFRITTRCLLLLCFCIASATVEFPGMPKSINPLAPNKSLRRPILHQ